MSVSTYTELKAAVADWLHSTAYTANIPDWIAAGESRLNTVLNLTAMQAFSTLTADTTSRFLALPSRYISPISLYLLVSSTVRVKLTSRSAENMAAIANIVAPTQPRYYNIGAQIEFDCTPNLPYSLTFNYYKKLDIASDTTNFLLTSNYKVYLYAALVEAWTYREDDAKIQRYEALLQAEIDRVSANDNSNRSVSRLVMDSALARPVRSNIFLG